MAAAGSARKIRGIGGTKCTVVIRWVRMVSARYSGSGCPSGFAATRNAPAHSGQKNSHTDTSNPAGVFCSTRSSAARGYSACIQGSRLTMARWVTAAPFGRPVEPTCR